MKTPTETEAILSREDVRSILRICSSQGVLVGGQSLAFWADHFELPRPDPLVVAISADVDFIADSVLAKKLAEALGWKWWIPDMDDATFQTGKVTHKLEDGSVKQADFLAGVVGLATHDVVRRAVEVEVPELGKLRVMHPIDLLHSRIQNLLLLREKRTPAGIAQAELAVAVVAAYIRDVIRSKGEKDALKLLERVAAIAGDAGAVRIFLLYGIDPLQAVPIEDFRTTTALHTKRWPQIVARVREKRDKIRRLFERREQGAGREKS